MKAPISLLTFYTLLSLLSCKTVENQLIPIAINHTSVQLPNCLKVGDNLFVDKSEVSNIDYKEFMYSTSLGYSTESITYQSQSPVMTGYVKSLSDKSGMMKDSIALEKYHFDEPYDTYPVTSVTLKQIQKYSDWRSRKVFEMILVKNGYLTAKETSENDKRRLNLKDIIIKYSKDSRFDAITHYPLYYVPDSTEWNIVYNKCLRGEIKIGQLNSKKTAQKHQYNTGLPVSPSKGFDTNNKLENTLYHFIGNLAEILSDDGYTAGGDYFQNQKELLGANNIRKEHTPSATVGFRNFCKWVKIERQP